MSKNYTLFYRNKPLNLSGGGFEFFRKTNAALVRWGYEIQKIYLLFHRVNNDLSGTQGESGSFVISMSLNDLSFRVIISARSFV